MRPSLVHFFPAITLPTAALCQSELYQKEYSKIYFIGPFKEDPVLLVSRCRLISSGPLPGKLMVSSRICDRAAFKIKQNSVVPFPSIDILKNNLMSVIMSLD